MRAPALMAALCLTSISACAQPAPGQYGQDGAPPGYGQAGPGYGQAAPPPGSAGGWAGGMQGAGGQMPPQDQSGGPPPPTAGDQAPAQRGGREKMRDKFAAANVTHDGRLTLQQAQSGNLRQIARHFSQIDRDQKGYVTVQDIKAWKHEKHAQKVGQPPADRGGQDPGTPAYPPASPGQQY